MAKKNLKHALKAHEAKKAQAARAKVVEEAEKRRHDAVIAASSGQGSVGNRAAKRKRRRAEEEQNACAGPVKVTGDASLSHPNGQSRSVQEERSQRAKAKARMLETDDTVLLIGEGNFSFARALLQPPHSHPPHLVLATAFDTEEQCYSKYPDAKENVAAIRRIAGRDSVVAFGVDAGQISNAKPVNAYIGPSNTRAGWSKIIFNFPHVGAGHKDETRNVMANQLMLLRFFVSAAGLLTRGALPAHVEKAKGKKAGGKRVQEELDDDAESEASSVASDADVEQSEDEDEDETRHDSESIPRAKGVKRFLPPPRAGSILVTIRDVKPYTLWDIPTLAKRPHDVLPAIAHRAPALPRGQKLPSSDELELLAELAAPEDYRVKKRSDKAPSKEFKHGYRVWRSFAFDPEDWPGYSHRRTLGWRDGVSTDNNEDIIRTSKGEDGRDGDARGHCRTFELALQS